MLQVDDWFRAQMLRIGKAGPRRNEQPRWGVDRLQRADRSVRSKWAQHGSMVLGSFALTFGIGMLTAEAMHGPLRADQPFGLSAPPAVFRASSMPSVNGHAPRAPIDDRNTVVMSGMGTQR